MIKSSAKLFRIDYQRGLRDNTDKERAKRRMHVWTGYFSDAQDGIDLYKSSTNDQLIDLFKLIDLSKSPTNDQLISIEMVENAMHCWCQQLSVPQIPQMFSIYKLMIRK